MTSFPILIYLFLSLLFILALLRPQWAILACLSILPSYLLKLSIFGIPTTVLELSIYAAFVGSIFFYMISNNLKFGFWNLFGNWKLEIGNSKPLFLWPILTWLIITFLSALFADNNATTLGGWKAWVLDPLLVFILIIKFFKPQDIWKIIATLSISSVVLSFYGLIEYFVWPGQLGDGRLDSVFDPANYHAMFVGPIIVLAIGFIFNQQTPRIWLAIRSFSVGWKFILSITSAINLIALIFTFSYGGYLAVLGGLTIYGFLALNRAQKKKMIFGALIIFGIFIILASPTKKFQDLFEFQERSSGHARLEIWQTSWLIFKEHPILGVGLNDFEYHYRENLPRVAFPPLEWLVAQPHSLYLALLTQAGLLGFLAFLWIIVQFFRTTKSTIYQLLTANPTLISASSALVSAFSALLLHGLVDTPYFKNDLSIFFWVLIALIIIQNQQPHQNQASKTI